MEPAKKSLRDELKSLQIQRTPAAGGRKGRWRGVILSGLLLFLVSGGLFLISRSRWSLADIGSREVRAATATRRNTSGSQPVLSAGGYLIARFQVEVGSKATGRVVSIEVWEGDMVRAGQVIARLDDVELRAQVRQAEAGLAAAQAQLKELETGSRPQEIDRAKADLERAEAQAKNAQLVLTRTEKLVKDRVVEPQALDDARARYDVVAAERRSAAETLELARIGPRQEAIDLARAQTQQAEANLVYSRALLENTVIRAPISGTVLDRYVDLGEMVTIGFTSDRGAKQAVVAIADLKDLQVEMDVSEADIGRARLGQPVAIRPDAYPERRYAGLVEYISAVADRQKATIKVKVKVLDPDGYLRPDMGAKITFYEEGAAIPDQPDVVLVPSAAILRQAGGPVVLLVRDDKVLVQPVKTGQEADGYTEILSGLQGGERVILDSLTDLKSGDRVTIRGS